MNIQLLMRGRRQLRCSRRLRHRSRRRNGKLRRWRLQRRHHDWSRTERASHLVPAHRRGHVQAIAARGATEREELILWGRKGRRRRQLRSRELSEHFRRWQHQRAVAERTGDLLSREPAIDLNAARA